MSTRTSTACREQYEPSGAPKIVKGERCGKRENEVFTPGTAEPHPVLSKNRERRAQKGREETKFSLRAQPSRILFYPKTGKGERKEAGKKRNFRSGHSRAASCFIQKRGMWQKFFPIRDYRRLSKQQRTILQKEEHLHRILSLKEDIGENKILSENKKRQACKPGSVPSGSPAGSHHLSGTTVARSLYLPTPRKTEHGQHSAPKGFSVYAAFHPVRFARLVVSPRRRWALTPPFHPYRPASGEAVIFCCTVCGAGDASHTPSR